jgi:hypothetical protein
MLDGRRRGGGLDTHSCAAGPFGYAIVLWPACRGEVGVQQQERYWLIAQGGDARIRGELHAGAFVHSEVPVGDETTMALEIFTSQELAEAELRSMDRLAPDAYLDAVERYGEEDTSQTFDNTEPAEVVSLSRSELVSVLGTSGLMYVLVDPQPGDQPQPEHLPIRLALEFAEGLRDG